MCPFLPLVDEEYLLEVLGESLAQDVLLRCLLMHQNVSGVGNRMLGLGLGFVEIVHRVHLPGLKLLLLLLFHPRLKHLLPQKPRL
jgi:hypothetical protein